MNIRSPLRALPASEYQLTGGPELLWHDSPDLTKQDCKSEIWIPLEKRKQ
jgi:AraC family transcriptional regulator